MAEEPTEAKIILENIKKELIAGPPKKILEWLNDLVVMQEKSEESHKKALNELKEKHQNEIGEKCQEIFEVRQENQDLRKELKQSKELSVQVSDELKEKHEKEIEEQLSIVSDLKEEINGLRRNLKKANPRVDLNKKS